MSAVKESNVDIIIIIIGEKAITALPEYLPMYLITSLSCSRKI